MGMPQVLVAQGCCGLSEEPLVAAAQEGSQVPLILSPKHVQGFPSPLDTPWAAGLLWKAPNGSTDNTIWRCSSGGTDNIIWRCSPGSPSRPLPPGSAQGRFPALWSRHKLSWTI